MVKDYVRLYICRLTQQLGCTQAFLREEGGGAAVGRSTRHEKSMFSTEGDGCRKIPNMRTGID